MPFFLKEISMGNDPALMASFETERKTISHCSLFTHFPDVCVTATAKKGYIQLINIKNRSFQTFLTHLDGVILPLEAPLRFITLSPALFLAHHECHHIFYALAHSSELLCANFNTGTVSVIGTFSARPSAIFADGEYVICGTSDGEIHCWRATTLLYEGATLRTRPQGVANMSIERSLMFGNPNSTNTNNYFFGGNGTDDDSYVSGPVSGGENTYRGGMNGLTTEPNHLGEMYPTTFVNDSGSIQWRVKAGRAGISSLYLLRDFLVVAADDFTLSIRSVLRQGEIVTHLTHPSVRVRGIVEVGLVPTIQLCIGSERGGITVYEKVASQESEYGRRPVTTISTDPFAYKSSTNKNETEDFSSFLSWNIVGAQHLSSIDGETSKIISSMAHANQFLVVGTEGGKVTLFDTHVDDRVVASSKNNHPNMFRELVSFDVHHKVISAEILKDDCLVVVTSNGDLWRWPMTDVVKAIPPRATTQTNTHIGASDGQVSNAASTTNRPAVVDTSRLFFNESTASDVAPPAPRVDPSPKPTEKEQQIPKQYPDAPFVFDKDALETHNGNYEKNIRPNDEDFEADYPESSVADLGTDRMTVTSLGGISKITTRTNENKGKGRKSGSVQFETTTVDDYDEGDEHEGPHEEKESKRFPTRMSTTASARAVSVAAQSDDLHYRSSRNQSSRGDTKDGGDTKDEDENKSVLYYDPNNYAPTTANIASEENENPKILNNTRQNLNQSTHPHINATGDSDPIDEALKLYKEETKSRKNKTLTVSIPGLKEGKRMDPRRVQYGLDVAAKLSGGGNEEGAGGSDDEHQTRHFDRPASLNPYNDEEKIESQQTPLDDAAASYAAQNPTMYNALKLKHAIKGVTFGLHEPVYAAHPALAHNPQQQQQQHLSTTKSTQLFIQNEQPQTDDNINEIYEDDDDDASIPSQMQGSLAENEGRNHQGSHAVGSSPIHPRANKGAERKQNSVGNSKPQSSKQLTHPKVDDLIDATFEKFARKKDERFERERAMSGPDINRHGCEDLLFPTLFNQKMLALAARNKDNNSGNKNPLLSDVTQTSQHHQNQKYGKGAITKNLREVQDQREVEMFVVGGVVAPPPVNTIFFAYHGNGNGIDTMAEDATLFGRGPFQDYFIQSLPLAP